MSLSSAQIKYTKHRTVTSKLVRASPSREWAFMDAGRLKPPRIVRILVTDGDATDSSSSDEDEECNQKVKRHINEIKMETCSVVQITRTIKQKKTTKNSTAHGRSEKHQNFPNGIMKYIGVRQRTWGSGASEIRDSATRSRVWLGTCDTPEEATLAYNNAAIRLKVPGAPMNFTEFPPKFIPPHPIEIDWDTISGYDSGKDPQSICSPTPVLRFQPNEEIELGAKSKPESLHEQRQNSDWPVESNWVRELKEESCRSLRECLLDPDSLHCECPPIIFSGEIEMILLEETNLKDNYCNFLDKLDIDFESFSWDIENYY